MDNEFNEYKTDTGFSTSDSHGENKMNGNLGNDFQGEIKKNKKRQGMGMVKYGLLTLIVSLTTSIIASTATYYIAKENIPTRVVSDPPAFSEEADGLTKTEVYKRVSPAVVTVSTKSMQNTGYFFQEEVEGIGSGFIINEEGYIITNYHVIEGATEVSVILSDNTEVKAKVVNYDSNQDVAMLKIVDNIKVPAVAELGDSDALQPGEEVIAIGTPLSKEFSQTTTSGIISATNREVSVQGGVQTNLLQTDTAINPGNSGGPLVNSKGQVIGINTLKVAEGAESIGFAIPINDIKTKIESLSKPILNLGVTVMEINEEVNKKNNLKLDDGLYVKDIEEFSVAEKAGIRRGDLITHFDGSRIKTFAELQEIKNKKNAGDVIKVTVQRDGKEVVIDLTLQAKEE